MTVSALGGIDYWVLSINEKHISNVHATEQSNIVNLFQSVHQ